MPEINRYEKGLRVYRRVDEGFDQPTLGLLDSTDRERGTITIQWGDRSLQTFYVGVFQGQAQFDPIYAEWNIL